MEILLLQLFSLATGCQTLLTSSFPCGVWVITLYNHARNFYTKETKRISLTVTKLTYVLKQAKNNFVLLFLILNMDLRPTFEFVHECRILFIP